MATDDERVSPRPPDVTSRETLGASEPRAGWTPWHAALPELVLAALLLFAFRLALRATLLLEWPHDFDLFRDIAAAQRLFDCRCLADPFYRGETLWYNPLVPTIVAILSAISHDAVHTVYMHAGVWLNLIGPLGFFALTRSAFGRWTAVAATFTFMFLINPAAPAWASATYSPWLFAGVFAQGIFYFALLVQERVRRTATPVWNVLGGLALGLTFLAHTAPALILGVGLVVSVLMSRSKGQAARGLLVQLIAAGVMASPVLYSILVRYHLQVRNLAPAAWGYPMQAADMLPSAPPGSFWLTGPLLVVGVIEAIRRPAVRRRAGAVWYWAIASVLWFWYASAPAWTRAGLHFPRALPSFHFAFYLRALSCVFVGYGAVCVIQVVARGLERGVRLPAASATSVLLAILIGAGYYELADAYHARHDFTEARYEAWRMSARPGARAAYDWIRRNTSPDDVVLASDTSGLYVVGPAGRNAVAIDPVFSNPFVDVASRAADRDRMWAAARRGDASVFQALASAYGVHYVLSDAPADGEEMQRAAGCFLSPRLEIGATRIFAVEPGVSRACR